MVIYISVAYRLGIRLRNSTVRNCQLSTLVRPTGQVDVKWRAAAYAATLAGMIIVFSALAVLGLFPLADGLSTNNRFDLAIGLLFIVPSAAVVTSVSIVLNRNGIRIIDAYESVEVSSGLRRSRQSVPFQDALFLIPREPSAIPHIVQLARNGRHPRATSQMLVSSPRTSDSVTDPAHVHSGA